MPELCLIDGSDASYEEKEVPLPKYSNAVHDLSLIPSMGLRCDQGVRTLAYRALPLWFWTAGVGHVLCCVQKEETRQQGKLEERGMWKQR